MKLLLSFIIIFLNVGFVNGQIDTGYINLLQQKLRKLQPEGTIYYADKPDRKLLQGQYQYLRRKNFISYGQSGSDSILTITGGEQQYLITEIKKSLYEMLPDNLFENSKRLSSDSIVPFVDQLNLRTYDSIRHLSDSGQIRNAWKRRFKYWSFTFTKPIYIRSSTIFLQYFMYYSLNGGEHYFVFYKKRNNKWFRWITVGGGAW